jgi:hypothetical protein
MGEMVRHIDNEKSDLIPLKMSGSDASDDKPSSSAEDQIWREGRDAALREIAEFARLSPHLVHPLFIPAVEGLKHTLLSPYRQ